MTMSTVAEFNNNPGNLKPVGFTYKDQIGVDDRGFAVFATKEAGRNALIQDIQIKQKKGINTPQSFIDKYAPAGSENSEEGRDNYKVGMAGHLGLKNTNEPFPDGSAEKIADFITSFESGKQATPEAPKVDPNNPFAAGVPLADKARQASTTEVTTDTTPPVEEFLNPAIAAGTGALISGVGQVGYRPEYFGTPPDINEIKESARGKISTLEEAGNKTIASLQEAEDKALRRHQIAADRLQTRMSNPSPIAGGQTLADLELDFKISQYALQSADRELKARLAEQKAKVPATPAATTQNVLQTGSMASATPQIITDLNAPVSRTATEQMMQGTIDPETGTTGRQRMNFNEVSSFQKLQRENQEKALLEASKSGVVPDSGQRARLAFGMPDATPSGIIVQPEVAAPLKQQAELEQRMVDDKAAQERLAQQEEMQRLKNERALAAQQQSEAQKRFEQAQRAKTSGVTRAQTVAETAADRQAAAEADLASGRKLAKTAPGMVARPLEVTGVKSGKAGIVTRAGIGAIGGLQAARGINELANMPIEELIKRYQAGERSPELLAAIQQAAGATAQTGFGAAATVPVIGPRTARIKGAGAIGTGLMGAYEGYKALTEKEPQ